MPTSKHKAQSHAVFDYQDYKEFLRAVLATSGEGRGLRSKLAKTLRCQTAFISHVLNGSIHFSLEHAIHIGEFLKFSQEEAHYFMLLLQYGRAGSKTLEAYFQKQIQAIHEKRQVVRERIQVKQGLSKEDQVTYYSAWYYAAVHVLTSVPGFQDKAKIAAQLKLPLELVAEILEFLCSTGLAIQVGADFKIGTARIHLGNDSPMLRKHHMNWRIRAINSFDQLQKSDLHYSSVVSLSESDTEKIRSILLGAIEKSEPILRASPEETVFCLALDFFRI
ncbi:TIGR02147 family protein [Bdellovibrionota bacterium FG-1]